MKAATVRGVHTPEPIGTAEPPAKDDYKPKYTKSDADYGKGKVGQKCANCRFFKANDSTCQVVMGGIEPDAWCKFFAKRGKRLDDDAGSDNPDDRAQTDGDSDDADSLAEAEEINQKKLQPKQAGDLKWKRFYEVGRTVKLDDAQATKRSWVPVFPEGVFQHPEYGELSFTSKEIPEYIDNFYGKVRHIDPCVDIDHRNEEAAGWLKELDWKRGDGLYALVEWNDLGLGLIKDKRYRYISAQFGDYLDEETGKTTDNVISALTLTNFPFLKQMPALQLAEADKRRDLYRALSRWNREVRGGKLHAPADLVKELSEWVRGEGRAQERFELGLAMARRLAALEGSQGTEMGKAKQATLPQFIKGKGDSGMAKADDDDNAKKAKKADDELDDDDATKKADDDELDDDSSEAMDDDDAQAKKASISDGKGYDDDDAWATPENASKAPNSRQPKRSDTDPSPPGNGEAGGGKGTQGGMHGRATSERGMSASRLLAENQQMRERLAVVEKTLRENAVDKQLRELGSPNTEGFGFGDKVLDEFEAIALRSEKAGDTIFKFLNLIREDGGFLMLNEMGHGADGDDDHDPILLASRDADVSRSEKGEKVSGVSVVKLAKEYAKQNQLDWEDPNERLEAIDAAQSGKVPSDKGRARARRR